VKFTFEHLCFNMPVAILEDDVMAEGLIKRVWGRLGRRWKEGE
jgi:hypothetical protein